MKRETEVVLGYDQDNSAVWNQFATAITELSLNHGRKSTVADATYDFSGADGTIKFTKSTQAYYYDVDREAAAYIYDNRNQRTVTITVAARSQKDALSYMTELKALATIEKITDETLVNVNFWSMTSYGGNFRSRKLTVPAWDEIGKNYPGDTKQELDAIMSQDFRPGSGGQLILWYGEPGTGKTTALRALAREWKDWCNVEYIADPEKFFGSETEYMLSVLIKEDDDDITPWQSHDHSSDTENDEKNKWRLLVLEDAGELLAHDARQLSGAGLGRFLNVVDGLIGQGLKIIVLVTTNEELGHFHDAVSRPGRCLAQIKFGSFSEADAEEWLEDKDSDAGAVGDQTLAELYAKLHKNEVRIKKPAGNFGFGS